MAKIVDFPALPANPDPTSPGTTYSSCREDLPYTPVKYTNPGISAMEGLALLFGFLCLCAIGTAVGGILYSLFFASPSTM